MGDGRCGCAQIHHSVPPASGYKHCFAWILQDPTRETLCHTHTTLFPNSCCSARCEIGGNLQTATSARSISLDSCISNSRSRRFRVSVHKSFLARPLCYQARLTQFPPFLQGSINKVIAGRLGQSLKKRMNLNDVDRLGLCPARLLRFWIHMAEPVDSFSFQTWPFRLQQNFAGAWWKQGPA